MPTTGEEISLRASPPGRTPPTPALVCFLLCLACVSGCGPEEGRPDASSAAPSARPTEDASEPALPNLVLVSIDTLRADHLGTYGYFRETSPVIDAFATEATLFELAYSPIATTLPAHASMFTGLYPLEHGILANIKHGGRSFAWNPKIVSLTALLREAGYQTAGFVSATPLKRNTGFGSRFETYSEPDGHERIAEHTVNLAIEWLGQPRAHPFFLFVHLFDPHWPRRPLPPFDTAFHTTPALQDWIRDRAIPDLVQAGRCRARTATHTALNLYAGEVLYTDSQVGRLFSKLREAGLWDQSFIVLTADHGEGLNQHGWPAHGRNWNEQLHVPLMILPPAGRRSPGRHATPVSLVDLAPTLVTQMQVPGAQRLLRQATGVDLFSDPLPERPLLGQRSGRDCGDGAGEMFTLTTRRWRYFHQPSQGDLLFDLERDPFELNDLSAEQPQVARDQRARLLAMIDGQLRVAERLGLADAPAGPVLDAETLRELEALGYIERSDDTQGETDPSP